MQPYVNDYKMHLIEARKNNLKLHNINNRDLFNLLEILFDKDKGLKKAKEQAIKYTEDHDVNKSVIMTAAGAANCKLNYDILTDKEDDNMCTVFEENWAEGKAEGMKQGLQNGQAKQIIKISMEYNVETEKIISKLITELNISRKEADEYIKKYGK